MKLETVLAGISEVAYMEIRKDFRADCCIAATRAVLRVLKYFGYEGKPVPVHCFIYNASFVRAVTKGDQPPKEQGEFKEWCKRTGAWSLGIGFLDPEKPDVKGFEGHLIAVVNDTLIDASLKQADRPHHKIVLPPVLVSQFYSFPFAMQSNDGQRLEYEQIENERYRQSPDWTDKHRTKRAMKKIIEHIESKGDK